MAEITGVVNFYSVRERLFQELKARVKEDDNSVPLKKDG
jgi:protease II